MSGRAIKDLMRNVAVKDGCKPQRIARNTMKYINRDGATVYRLHDTDIVTLSADRARLVINNGGWRTMTTRDRVNMALLDCRAGFRVYSRLGARLWQLTSPGGYSGPIEFYRTITLVNGQPVHDAREAEAVESAKQEYAAQRKAARAGSYERRKERERERLRAKHGAAVFDAWESERAAAIAARKAAKESR